MYIKYICNKKCQVLLWFICFSSILRQICLWINRDVIHEICRNSHFRVLKIQNSFIRPPWWRTFFYNISAPTFEMATPCLDKFRKTALKKQIAIYLYHNKSFKAYFIQRFIIALYWNKLQTFENISALNLL